jgi:hypothetical protein
LGYHRILEVVILYGDHAGEIALIPRITLSHSVSGNNARFQLNHLQFPVQTAFAMTINQV